MLCTSNISLYFKIRDFKSKLDSHNKRYELNVILKINTHYITIYQPGNTIHTMSNNDMSQEKTISRLRRATIAHHRSLISLFSLCEQ